MKKGGSIYSYKIDLHENQNTDNQIAVASGFGDFGNTLSLKM